jgi:hypothetical protein
MPLSFGFRSSRPMSPGLKFFFSRIFPLPFILVGAVVFFIGVRNFNRARESVLWPTVEGRVAHSEMTISWPHANDSHQSNTPTYGAEVLYKYQLSGTTYSSNRVGFGDYESGDPSHAQSILNRYPRGISVQVHYNPQSPELSVLETGVHGATYFLPIGGLLFFVAGCIMLWGLPKLFRQMPAQAPSSDSAG